MGVREKKEEEWIAVRVGTLAERSSESSDRK